MPYEDSREDAREDARNMLRTSSRGCRDDATRETVRWNLSFYPLVFSGETRPQNQTDPEFPGGEYRLLMVKVTNVHTPMVEKPPGSPGTLPGKINKRA